MFAARNQWIRSCNERKEVVARLNSISVSREPKHGMAAERSPISAERTCGIWKCVKLLTEILQGPSLLAHGLAISNLYTGDPKMY
jgi:hypothetical protein